MRIEHPWRSGLLRVVLASCVGLCLASARAAGPDLQQGWTADQKDAFWYTSQGSRLIPRDWLLALEREDGAGLFLADGLARFGYLPGRKSGRNPDGLPIGFAVDTVPQRPWIGMTCAACHTSDMTYKGITLRIEGGAAGADMYRFLAALGSAAEKTANDDVAFARFAARVLGAGDTPARRSKLRDDADEGLRKWSRDFSVFVQQSTPEKAAWGPSRLDAFGMIFNRVTAIDLGIKENNRPPDAPVSYPFLWGTHFHDKTQWNGAVDNRTELQQLGRNVGQVLGVFATIDIHTYRSSVHLGDLRRLERTLGELGAPRWPDAFGIPDAQKVARGRTLYENNCVQCHALVSRQDQFKPARVKAVGLDHPGLGTDATMTTRAATRTAKTGTLKGRPVGLLPGKTFGDEALAGEILGHMVAQAILHGLLGPELATPGMQPLFNELLTQGTYKARPLNGIWATAPYLHNGSVRTLEQLLTPPQQREPRFLVGSREFDPVAVGFESASAPGAAQPFVLDTGIEGNYNRGHTYGTGLPAEDREALLQFLKTL